MALYDKWDVKNGFTYVLQFFSLISDGLGGVPHFVCQNISQVFIVIGIYNFDKSNESMTYHFEASNSSLLVSFSLGLLSSFLVCT